MKTWVSSSLYLKSTLQQEKPSLSNLTSATLTKESDSLLVEPWKGLLSGVEVGVLPLPLLKVEGRLWQVVQRVLLLGLGWHIWLLLVVGFRLGGLGGFGSLGGGLGLWLLGLLSLGLGWGAGWGVGQGGVAWVEDLDKLGVVDDADVS